MYFISRHFKDIAIDAFLRKSNLNILQFKLLLRIQYPKRSGIIFGCLPIGLQITVRSKSRYLIFVMATGKSRIVPTELLYRFLLLLSYKTYIRTLFHFRSQPFFISLISLKNNLYTCRFQSRRGGFEYRGSRIIGAKSNSRFPVHDTDITVRFKTNHISRWKFPRTGN